jgi:purine-binding chemotaxis protein CheW
MTAPTQYLTFMLGSETFAVGILAIREIIEYAGVTPVPHMPPCISGVINLRGAAVPVLNMACRLERTPEPVGKRTCIVIVEVGSGEDVLVAGLLVDAVNAVLEIGAADIEPPPPFGARVRADLLQGIGKVNGRFVLLLDIQHVVAAGEIAAMAETPQLA